ncbi:hypothetical protein TCELL_0969 [Thermogladius calderae 1633]|uniref:Uncharacterized protein n=1 Tax=Thermogladius calderae (strain DSM 22663 / VKM B-2946 / 1633) TaxID=1184251 RepID=I3TF54_THEC1|nr:hypothetical protein TCELL_0969 [Thermogladius calderae 1633]
MEEVAELANGRAARGPEDSAGSGPTALTKWRADPLWLPSGFILRSL